MRTLPIVLALGLAALAFLAPGAAASDPNPDCWQNEDGSTTCKVRTLMCFSQITIHPDGTVDGWLLAC